MNNIKEFYACVNDRSCLTELKNAKYHNAHVTMHKPNDMCSYMIFGIFKLYCKCYVQKTDMEQISAIFLIIG